jgi:hypothetical protein
VLHFANFNSISFNYFLGAKRRKRDITHSSALTGGGLAGSINIVIEFYLLKFSQFSLFSVGLEANFNISID